MCPVPTVLPPAPATRTHLEELASYIASVLPRYVQVAQVTPIGELELLVAPSAVTPVLTFLRDDSRCLFKSLADLCGVDVPKREKRFEVGRALWKGWGASVSFSLFLFCSIGRARARVVQ